MSPFIPEAIKPEAPTVEQQMRELYCINYNFLHKIAYLTQRVLANSTNNFHFYFVESEGKYYLNLLCRREGEGHHQTRSFCIPFDVAYGGEKESTIGIDFEKGSEPGNLYLLKEGTPIFTDEERKQLSQFASKYPIQVDKETVIEQLLRSVS